MTYRGGLIDVVFNTDSEDFRSVLEVPIDLTTDLSL